MKTGTTNIKLNYKPLNAVKSLKTLSGSERQNYNADTLMFEPDRRIDPLVIMVECGVTDPHNLKNGNVNSDLNSVSWKISENGVFKDILDSNSDFNIGKNKQKGQLTIYKNISDLEPVTIVFTAKYLEPISKRVVNFQENFDLITLPIAQTPLNLEATMLIGGTLFVNKNQDGLLTQARLFRGIEQIPAAYYWYKGATEITDTNGYVGSKTEKLFIPSSQISKTGDVVRVEVADCSDYVNQLVNQKVDTDAQVVEWKGLFQSEGKNFYKKTTVISPANVMFEKNHIDCPNGFHIVGENNNNLNSVRLHKVIDSNGEWTISFELRGSQNKIIGLDIDICDSVPIRHYSTIDNTWKKIIHTVNVKNYTPELYNFIDFSAFIFENYFIRNIKIEKGNKATDWSPSKQDLQDLVTQKITQYKSETKLPENYRPATKPAKTYKADYLLIKKFPEYKEEVLITQGGIDPSVSSVQAEMIIKTNDGLLQNPEKYFSVGWLKQTNGTFKYKGFKVNISMADIVALNAENKELDYELREDLTLQ